jgi:hypothetical protein
MAGQSSIPILIAEKVQGLVKQVVPAISQIASQTGIENIGQPDMKMPDTCLSPAELQKILDLRNNILSQMNTVSSTIETLSKTINPLNTVITKTSQALNIASTTQTAANIAMSFIPSPVPGVPGFLPASINTLGKVISVLDPIIKNTQNKITTISDALDYANSILFKLIGLLKSIDAYLTKCGAISETSKLTSLNGYLSTVEQDYSQVENNPNIPEIYQGFILEIVEEPFSPTVNRRKAVAKNSQGIILLQTPLSFTTIPQILIQELKLIIDSNNLKAI